MIPVVKAWCTDIGVAVASTGIQVHGGMGYIEETGAAQHLRDARIAPIYEGTNGIQANDLVGRKLARDKGTAATALFDDIEATTAALDQAGEADLAPIAGALRMGLETLENATAVLVECDMAAAGAGAACYLQLFGEVCAGWLMARQALVAQRLLTAGDGDPAFLRAKLATALFFAEHFLALAPGRLPAILGGATVLAFDPDHF